MVGWLCKRLQVVDIPVDVDVGAGVDGGNTCMKRTLTVRFVSLSITENVPESFIESFLSSRECCCRSVRCE